MRRLLTLALLVALAPSVLAQEATSGKYRVTLRLPPGGLYADEEAQVEFRVVDTSADDPVLGPPGVLRAVVDATVSMPAMPGMPKYAERAHAESIPGDYGVHPTFPHGGEYALSLVVTPPGGEPFSVSFPLAVRDADPTRPPAPKPYALEVETSPKTPRAGEPADLRLVVRARADKSVVRDFDVAHTKLIHLIVVREDLGVFAHEHPTQSADGSFALSYAFPTGGTYHLFADVAPRGRGSQVLLATVEVKPAKGERPAPFSLAGADAGRTSTADGVRATLATPDPVATRTDAVWTVSLADAASGAAVTDLEPYLGAGGHLVLVGEDGTTYVHSHPDETAEATPGRVRFLVRLPKPGFYRAWAQVQRGGKVLTFDWVVRAK